MRAVDCRSSLIFRMAFVGIDTLADDDSVIHDDAEYENKAHDGQ